MIDDQTPLVIIVDDDEEFGESLKILVETYGFRVELYASGELFLQNLRSLKKVCLLLDLHMPEFSGLQVLQALRARGILLRTIVVTGAGNSRLEAAAIRKGAIAVLDKPIQKGQLFELILRALS